MDSSLFAHRGHALRSGRFSEPGRAYLLTAVTHNRRPLFTDWHAARLLVAELRRAHDEQQVDSLAWVIMPDHLHWLVQLGSLPLPSLMQSIKSRSAIALHRAGFGQVGRLWQKGFHDHALRHEEALQEVARYIVANPLRAGLVKRIGDYPLWDAVWV
ncbi:REP-associated tyrosine transposase [Pseudomonas jinjuensis]|uniref:REP element-mobilizing transposase RayT n=1 Tax=Pseudomonas jinjuensis TaxID=198616 RepID=A0A1H0QH44_9PSED|nr:transposase [Pseudomonas jinjuensis]SDP16627.1 REP element-mobilizing transposase RayT [Pseudomonas jinjuensis]